ncbi:DUF4837 family protein [bacterium]|nr:DUF4837 family protein [bacterium]
MKIKLKVAPILFLFLVLVGCYHQPTVREPEYDIFVFAETDDWQHIERPLCQIFEKEIRTPQLEKLFTIHYADFSKLEKLSVRKNLLFVSTLESQGEIATIVKNMVRSPEMVRKIQQGKYFIFKKENQWVENQLLIALIAANRDSLVAKLHRNAQKLYNLFDKHNRKILLRTMYAQLENKKLEKQLLDKYGWSLRVQHDYFLVKEASTNGGFVFLRRSFPERWLFVHWVQTDDATKLMTPEWCLNRRDWIGKKFYENDRVNREFTTVKLSEFNGRLAYEVTGLWENEEKIAGGPYKAYIFYDEPTHRVYMIDIAVFAPNKRKLPYLAQLDVMAHTFTTRQEFEKK